MDAQSATAGGESQSAGLGDNFVTLTADIVAAYVGSANNHLNPTDVPSLITSVHQSLRGLSGAQAAPQEELRPAVSIRASVKPDYIVCLEDGKKLKMLKRYINTKYGMTPDQYRAKWGLSADYPMVAPNYADQRRELAKSIGLGTKRTRSAAGGRGAATGTNGGATGSTSTGTGRGRKASGNTSGTGTRGRKASGAAGKTPAAAKGGRKSGGKAKGATS